MIYHKSMIITEIRPYSPITPKRMFFFQVINYFQYLFVHFTQFVPIPLQSSVFFNSTVKSPIISRNFLFSPFSRSSERLKAPSANTLSWDTNSLSRQRNHIDWLIWWRLQTVAITVSSLSPSKTISNFCLLVQTRRFMLLLCY